MNIFDHINALTDPTTPSTYFDSLGESDQKTFNPYMVHRILSMHLDLIDIVAEFSKYTLEPNVLWKLYHSVLPKRKRFAKYIKAKNIDTYNNILIQSMASHLQISESEAVDAWDILKDNRELLEDFLQSMGYSIDEIDTLLK